MCLSVIVLVGHPAAPPSPHPLTVTTPHSHSPRVLYKLCVTLLLSGVLFTNPLCTNSPRCLSIFGLILRSCPGIRQQGVHLLLCTSVPLPTPAPLLTLYRLGLKSRDSSVNTISQTEPRELHFSLVK